MGDRGICLAKFPCHTHLRRKSCNMSRLWKALELAFSSQPWQVREVQLDWIAVFNEVDAVLTSANVPRIRTGLMASSQDLELDAVIFYFYCTVSTSFGVPLPVASSLGTPSEAPSVRGAVIMPLPSSACKIPGRAVGSPPSIGRGSYLAVAIT